MHRFVLRVCTIQIKKNDLVTFVSSFCDLYIFIMQLVMLILLSHIIYGSTTLLTNKYMDLISEIRYLVWLD